MTLLRTYNSFPHSYTQIADKHFYHYRKMCPFADTCLFHYRENSLITFCSEALAQRALGMNVRFPITLCRVIGRTHNYANHHMASHVCPHFIPTYVIIVRHTQFQAH